MKKVYHAVQLPLFILQKQCNKCPENGLQDIGNFPKDSHSRDGFYSICKECLKKYYQANKEHKKAQVRTYKQSHKEQHRIYSRRYRVKHHEKVREAGYRYRQAPHNQEKKRLYRKRTARHRYEYNKAYVTLNGEQVRQRLHKHYRDNRERRLAQVGDYQRRNVERIREYKRHYHTSNHDKVLVHRQRRRARRRAGGTFTAQEWYGVKIRYDFTCLCCGRSEPEIKLTPDHVVPLAHRGKNTIDNIQPLCLLCNLKKGIKTIDYRK